jgi:ferredoxin
MPPVLTICVDCERHALRFPKRGMATTEALACLTRLLLDRKRLRGLKVVREACLQNCPFGKICVTLKRGDQEVRHHLSPEDDLKAVAAKLAAMPRRS